MHKITVLQAIGTKEVLNVYKCIFICDIFVVNVTIKVLSQLSIRDTIFIDVMSCQKSLWSSLPHPKGRPAPRVLLEFETEPQRLKQ